MTAPAQYDEPDNTTAASGWGCIVVLAGCLAFWAGVAWVIVAVLR